MNAEIVIIICTVFGGALFALGGTEIPMFGRGFKWLRREVLPLLWALLALVSGFEWWRCVGLAVSYDVVFRLPYGDRTPRWLKFLVFMAYPLPSLFLGFNVWQLYVGGLCFLFWALSNWKPTARMFEWVISCLLMGGFLGVMVGQLIGQTYQ
jgi:hypothetical protein